MSDLDRRTFLRSSGMLMAAVSVAAPLQSLFSPAARADESSGYGPLVKDPNGHLDLPSGFRYEVLSRTGERMHDGFLVPGLHDGMAAFRAENGNTLLVRNHEVSPYQQTVSPFKDGGKLPSGMYDPVGIGGTTTLEVDRNGKLVRHFLSLAGTVRNCAGGPTPWGTWVSCEETVLLQGQASAPDSRTPGVVVERSHGYNFEVDSRGSGTTEAIPLKDMGRFNHEAIAVDPGTGYVYQTEDRGDGCLYRFRPNERDRLLSGGTLEALKITGLSQVHTNNWPGNPTRIRTGRRYSVEWVPIRDVDPVRDEVRYEGWARGAAAFSRGEGIYYSRGSIYVAATDGGPDRLGQIWRLRPGRDRAEPDTLELFVEVERGAILNNPDNMCATRSGELVVCEDGRGEQMVVGVTRRGELYPIARNALNASEFAGATFSPDGRILFVNVQSPGITYAILGPWRQ